MKTWFLVTAVVVCSLAAQFGTFAQGDLAPPGAPGPTMRTLDQLEPRTPVPSVPFTISAGGSYYLTGNLTDTGSVDGITIDAHDVTLDLGGFCVDGKGQGNDGIVVTGSRTNICIRNGTVTGWVDDGVDAENAVACQVLNVRVSLNQDWGIVVGERSVVEGCVAFRNVSGGISADMHALIGKCLATWNQDTGILAAGGGTVRDCVSLNNWVHGIRLGDVSTATGCTSRDNGGCGLGVGAGSAANGCASVANGGNAMECGEGSTIVGCATRSSQKGIVAAQGSVIKDCSAVFNRGNGIDANVACTVIGCSVQGNGTSEVGHGINVGVGSVVKDCSSRLNNGAGIQTGTGCRVAGCTPHYNTGAGIAVLNDCVVADNDCYGNFQDGINVSLGFNRIDGNSVTENQNWGIQVTGVSNLVVRNSAKANTVGAYSISSTNAVGQILNVGGVTVISNASPWANFSL